jgi:hypothetical protein
MKTVKQLREELAEFPDSYMVYAYQGGLAGLIIVEMVGGTAKQRATIEADQDSDGEATQNCCHFSDDQAEHGFNYATGKCF